MMVNTIPTAPRSPRPFTVITYDLEWQVTRIQYPENFDDLAFIVERAYEGVKSKFVWGTEVVHIGYVRVFNYRNKPLSVEELVACAKNRERANRSWWKPPVGYVRRRTPMPSTGGWRRRRWAGVRIVQVMSERRLHAAVMKEEGEMPFRGRRTIPLQALTDPWEDAFRHNERCWKTQHKGRKNWDRPRLKA